MPNSQLLDDSDFRVWDTRSADPGAPIRPAFAAQDADSRNWCTDEDHIYFQAFASYQSEPCLVFLLIDEKKIAPRLLIRNQVGDGAIESLSFDSISVRADVTLATIEESVVRLSILETQLTFFQVEDAHTFVGYLYGIAEFFHYYTKTRSLSHFEYSQKLVCGFALLAAVILRFDRIAVHDILEKVMEYRRDTLPPLTEAAYNLAVCYTSEETTSCRLQYSRNGMILTKNEDVNERDSFSKITSDSSLELLVNSLETKPLGFRSYFCSDWTVHSQVAQDEFFSKGDRRSGLLRWLFLHASGAFSRTDRELGIGGISSIRACLLKWKGVLAITAKVFLRTVSGYDWPDCQADRMERWVTPEGAIRHGSLKALDLYWLAEGWSLDIDENAETSWPMVRLPFEVFRDGYAPLPRMPYGGGTEAFWHPVAVKSLDWQLRFAVLDRNTVMLPHLLRTANSLGTLRPRHIRNTLINFAWLHRSCDSFMSCVEIMESALSFSNRTDVRRFVLNTALCTAAHVLLSKDAAEKLLQKGAEVNFVCECCLEHEPLPFNCLRQVRVPWTSHPYEDSEKSAPYDSSWYNRPIPGCFIHSAGYRPHTPLSATASCPSSSASLAMMKFLVESGSHVDAFFHVPIVPLAERDVWRGRFDKINWFMPPTYPHAAGLISEQVQKELRFGGHNQLEPHGQDVQLQALLPDLITSQIPGGGPILSSGVVRVSHKSGIIDCLQAELYAAWTHAFELKKVIKPTTDAKLRLLLNGPIGSLRTFRRELREDGFSLVTPRVHWSTRDTSCQWWTNVSFVNFAPDSITQWAELHHFVPNPPVASTTDQPAESLYLEEDRWTDLGILSDILTVHDDITGSCHPPQMNSASMNKPPTPSLSHAQIRFYQVNSGGPGADVFECWDRFSEVLDACGVASGMIAPSQVRGDKRGLPKHDSGGKSWEARRQTRYRVGPIVGIYTPTGTRSPSDEDEDPAKQFRGGSVPRIPPIAKNNSLKEAGMARGIFLVDLDLDIFSRPSTFSGMARQDFLNSFLGVKVCERNLFS
ncbi:hypothetical protein BJ508DRAFT_140767 [Ascobolus immersus RN42]|uniref:Uncharacterized protein n=1 Tax=Ascobolus immersus RN42 TaxID=1160509 RepID=A0A3N4I2A2_ASCIM|nr:hypothetical protein BJ508DRAFT_140767 [Ascobolus immersus RN42]